MFSEIQAKRFWDKVDKAGPDECWLWKGAALDQGRGQLSIDKRKYTAPQVSLLLAGRDRPSGLSALHTCDVPACVNPNHLWWGTIGDNNRDTARKGRHHYHGRKRCKNDHDLTVAGAFYVYPIGKRTCRLCRDARIKEWRKKR